MMHMFLFLYSFCPPPALSPLLVLLYPATHQEEGISLLFFWYWEAKNKPSKTEGAVSINSDLCCGCVIGPGTTLWSHMAVLLSKGKYKI